MSPFQSIAIIGPSPRHAVGVLPTGHFAFDGPGVGALLHLLPSFADDACCRSPCKVDDMGNSPEA
jgi:hypothetical protein